MPSDHFAVICPLAMEKPKPSKLTIKCPELCLIDTEIFRSDILDSSLHVTNKTCDVNALITQYNSIMRNLSDKHAPECTPECTQTITLHQWALARKLTPTGVTTSFELWKDTKGKPNANTSPLVWRFIVKSIVTAVRNTSMFSMQLSQITIAQRLPLLTRTSYFRWYQDCLQLSPNVPFYHAPRSYVSPRVLITTLQLQLRNSGTILRK